MAVVAVAGIGAGIPVVVVVVAIVIAIVVVSGPGVFLDTLSVDTEPENGRHLAESGADLEKEMGGKYNFLCL